jgi:hypothetical protein
MFEVQVEREMNSSMPGSEHRVTRRSKVIFVLSVALAAMLCSLVGCTVDERKNIPAEAQLTIDTVTEDIARGRWAKVYDEAAEEWRNAVGSHEENQRILMRLRDRLGKVSGRTLHSGREQQSASSPLSGHALELVYQTTFERADGVEQFTLLERDGRWLLARYSVSSDALK